jgi:proteasome accessory factor C
MSARREPGTRVFGEHQGPPTSRYARKHLFFEAGSEREVVVRFSGTAAALVRERHGKLARTNTDGSGSVSLRTTPGNYLMGVVLGYGGEATVEGPGDVAQALRERVERLRELYRARD